jgi:tetratricopeptide (TPR) repeat protein
LSSLSPSPEPPPVDLPAEPLAQEELLADVRVPLRLTVTRGTLGLELYESVEIGPLAVTALNLSLPGLRFPVDLSGGVPRFRQRRGELEHARLRLDLDALAAFLLPRTEGVIGSGGARVQVWPLERGVGIGLVAGERALAFDILFAPDGGDARLLVCHARGLGLPGPALGAALRFVDSALPRLGERRGRAISIERAGLLLGRVLMPAVGARVPSAKGVRFGDLEVERDALSVELDTSFPPPATSPSVIREIELALLVADADQALAEGRIDSARDGYVSALERAPRHPEIIRLLAEIDAGVGARAEAALGLLVESLPAHRAGLVGAELLAATGDPAAARDAVREAVRDEPFAPLAALAFCRLAELDPDPVERRAALDGAVARAPGLAPARWARFRARLRAGDVEGAIADAEHLEAGAMGAKARHEACRQAARLVLEQGYVTEAGRLFERALRYLPDDAAATAGLARAFLEAGKKDRALVLLERAIALGERRGRPDSDALLDLARVLADEARDLPQAIARVRQVSAASERHVEARALEAGWRAQLGDLAGASLAYGRMREAIELQERPRPEFSSLLVEAASFEREAERDLAAAERHLAVAVRLSPRDEAIGRRYREVALELAEERRRARAKS